MSHHLSLVNKLSGMRIAHRQLGASVKMGDSASQVHARSPGSWLGSLHMHALMGHGEAMLSGLFGLSLLGHVFVRVALSGLGLGPDHLSQGLDWGGTISL